MLFVEAARRIKTTNTRGGDARGGRAAREGERRPRLDGRQGACGGGRRGYTKAEVEEIRARINALIDAYEALELEEGEEGEEGAAATDVEGLKDAVGTMVMDFKKKATARTSTLQAAHAGLVKADAGDALARDGDRTPEEIMELAKVIGEVVEIASGQKGRLKQVHDLEVTMLRDFAEDLAATSSGAVETIAALKARAEDAEGKLVAATTEGEAMKAELTKVRTELFGKAGRRAGRGDRGEEQRARGARRRPTSTRSSRSG